MNVNVIVASPAWSLSGVNVFSANLVRSLQAHGIPAHILLTNCLNVESKPMDLPTDIPVHELPVGRPKSKPQRWQAMIQYLESKSPCIYLPNYDFQHSCISPKLSNQVAIVGIVHSDDPQHYEHVSRLGKYWNSIVAVSKFIAKETIAIEPAFAKRLVTIPYGIPIAESFPERPLHVDAPLKIIYCGALKQYQKRIFDLLKIIQALQDRHVPVELMIVGGGPMQQKLIEKSRHLIKQGAIRFMGIVPHGNIPYLLQQNDVFILTSEFEGLPNALLEAMGQGCVPVVTNIKSGIPELVKEGSNGFIIPIGDITRFAERLTLLQRDVNLRQTMARNAYTTVTTGSYHLKDMANRYIELFEKIIKEVEGNHYHRPHGNIAPPPTWVMPWWHNLPSPVLEIARRGKRILYPNSY